MGQLSTILLRGATMQLLDDLERAVDDGVNAFRALCKASGVPAQNTNPAGARDLACPLPRLDGSLIWLLRANVRVQDARTVPAGGASEMEIAKQLADLARKETGLEQYAIQKFAEALEIIPRTLAENSGLNATDAVSGLWSAHANGDKSAGLDIETGGTKDLSKDDIVDLYTTKWWAIKLLSDAVCTILRVDHIIMAKMAGGPKPKAGDGDDE